MSRRPVRAILLAAAGLALVVAAGLSVAASPAQAGAPIKAFSVTPSTTQAGGHPDLRVFAHADNRATQNITPPTCNCQDVRDFTVQMPTGVIGDSHATPQCTAVDFGSATCPSDSQVGIAIVGLTKEPPNELGYPKAPVAVYNLVPHPEQGGLLGLNLPLANFPIYVVLNGRTESDYGLEAKVVNITHLLPLSFLDQRLWGVPASPSHDEMRFQRGCDPFFKVPPCFPGVPSNSPQKAFIDNPTTCGVPLTASAEAVAYDKEVTHAVASYPATTGCDQLSFNPSLFAQPTTKETDSASGLDVDLKVPQNQSPTTPSPSEIRALSVTFPDGLSINPNASDGKVACTDVEAGFGTRGPARCPQNSKLGTSILHSSALPGPISGYLYLAEPLPGNRYRFFFTASGYNTNVKLAATVRPDPRTGQMTISFSDLPQSPLTEIDLHFFGSERGSLATPTQCGAPGVKSTFTPWNSLLPEQNSEQFFSISSGPGGTPCSGAVRPFEPTFRAGVLDQSAGVHAPFALQMGRKDGDQNLSGLRVSTPPGFSATLAGIPYCPEGALGAVESRSGVAEQAASVCPAASRIGTASAGAGAGNHPVYLSGKVYLAGPYKGAPLSLAVITPAISGPYDLGNVLVRAALNVDPTDAHITAVSDRLPEILEGIPLRLRSILVELDRPGFSLNPTNCDPFSIEATIGGDQGAEASLSSHFQVADCAALPFVPKLALRLSGATKRTKNPALHAVLTANPGDANIARTSVLLPSAAQIDNAHIRTPCTRVQYAANACPAASVIGDARAESPLLGQPLEGKVYLRSSSHQLPDVVAALRGQIDVDVVGEIDSVNGGLRTRFNNVPDVPVTRFALNLQGGERGLLINSKNVCKGLTPAKVNYVGQNNKRLSVKVPLGSPCAKSPRHKRKVKMRLKRAGRVG